MSTLDSTSTRDEVLDAYADNASYAEDQSLAKAKAFVTACRLLLSPKYNVSRAKHGSNQEVELDLSLIKAQLTEAQNYVSASGSSGGGGNVRFSDFSNFR